MSDNLKLKLNLTRILEIPFQNYEKDFIFQVNDEEYQTNRIVADFLSPKISQIHFLDPTFNSFTIKTRNEGNFQFFIDLLNFSSNDIPNSELPFILEILEILENQSIIFEDQNGISSISIDNVFDLILNLEKNEKINSNLLKHEIDFISSHFYEIEGERKEKLEKLKSETLIKIFQNENLQLKSEDQLLLIINELYSSDFSFYEFYEFVQFTNVSCESMIEFLNLFDINDITHQTWKNLSLRLEKNIEKDKRKNQRYYQKVQHFNYNDQNEFNGIINYLIENDPNNINIISSSVNCNHIPDNVVRYNNTSVFFGSEDKENSWICIDFKNHQVIPTNYTIRTSYFKENVYHPKSWVIEGSNDRNYWEIIDEQENNHILNYPKIVHTFQFQNSESKKFRYLRMRQTDVNWGNNKRLCINAIEFYGGLI